MKAGVQKGPAETGARVMLRVWNANSHHLTYGNVGATVMGLRSWMLLNEVFKTGKFEMYVENYLVEQHVIERYRANTSGGRWGEMAPVTSITSILR